LLGACLGFWLSTVLGASREVVYRFDMDTDPGWQTSGSWAWGQPQGAGGDPASGHTGLKVYGFQLAGKYQDNLPAQSLVAGPFDFRNHAQVRVGFQRWLGVESSLFDQASVGVSRDGVQWTTVWTNSVAGILDTSWQPESLDLSAVADRQSAVYVRWTLGPTDGSLSYHGWNIDDVEFTGEPTDDLRITPLDGFGGLGLPGGPFSPVSKTFTLSNAGPAAVSWSAGVGAGWVSVSPVEGSLGPGQTLPVELSWNESTTLLPGGAHQTALVVSNRTSGAAFLRPVQLGLGARNQSLTWVGPPAGTRLRVGVDISLTATASSGLEVAFEVVSGPGTVSAGRLTPTGEGTLVVRAVQSGDARFLPANEERQFRVVRRPQSVTWQTPDAGVALTPGLEVLLSATVDTGRPVTFTRVSGPAEVTGDRMTPTGWGSIVVAAEVAGDGTFAPVRATCTFNRGSVVVESVGRWKGFSRGDAVGLWVAGGYAYVAQGEGGLAIVDIREPGNPVLVGSYDTPGLALAVQGVGSVVYVADDSGGLEILDVSRPEAPVRLGNYSDGGSVKGLFVSGTLAYLASDRVGLVIVDVSRPAQPVRVGGYNTPGNALGVQVVGSVAYVADRNSGVQILGVGVPSAPVLLGTLDTPGAARMIRVAGNLAYVADGTSGLQILNVATPSAPVRLAGIATGGSVYDVQVSGGLAYVASHTAGLRVVDVTRPASPVILGGYTSGGEVQAVQWFDGQVFLASGGAGLEILDPTPPSAPTLARAVENSGTARALEKIGDVIVLADERSGLRLIDVSDPTHPVQVGRHKMAGSALGLRVSEGHAFVAAGSLGLEIVDVSLPGMPMGVGSYISGGYTESVEVLGVVAYLADGFGGVQILDVSLPALPVWLGEYDAGGIVKSLHAVDGLLYVADQFLGLEILDVGDPTRPVRLGGLSMAGTVSEVRVVGGVAFVANGFAGLAAVDVRSPENPILLGGAGTRGFATGLEVVDNLVYVTSSEGGVEVFEVNDPAHPVRIAGRELRGEPGVVRAAGDFAYVATGVWGMEVIRFTEIRQDQTLDFDPPALVRTSDSPVRLEAVASSGLGVVLSVVSGPATLSGVSLSLTGPGTVVVRASQAGNAQFKEAVLERTLRVERSPQSLTWVSPAAGAPLVTGQTYGLTVATGSGLAVGFSVISGPGEVVAEGLRVNGSGRVVVQADQAGNALWEPASATRSFVAVALPDLVALDTSTRVNPDPAAPGFVWRIFNNASRRENTLNRAERALAGRLVDGEGRWLRNNADPAAMGIALAPAAPANPTNAPITFEIPTVLNLGQSGGDSTGWFSPDDPMPGIPGTDGSTDGTAVEVLTYLEMPAGLVTMGVNSDDGFRVTSGEVGDALRARTLGEWDGRRDGGETLFSFWVPEAGVYPFRLVYEEGGLASNLEWYTVQADGARVLINDGAGGGAPAYRSALGVDRPPRIVSISPPPGLALVNRTPARVEVILSDGDTKIIDEATIDFRIDGSPVTHIRREGTRIHLTWVPTGIRVPSESHQARLTFRSTTGGFVRTEPWTFRNLKNAVLPSAPRMGETFDAVTEGGLPEGWIGSQFTVSCDTGSDLANPRSEPYRGWLVVENNRLGQVDPGIGSEIGSEETLNGERLTLGRLKSGGVLFAAAAGRCDGPQVSRPASGEVGFGQVQFIESRPFDLSSVAHPVLAFSSGFTQGDDALGAVEYSVDAGATWKPVVIMMSAFRVVRRPDGAVDGPATMGQSLAESALWFSGGVLKGNLLGDALASPIDASIGDFIQARLNQDAADGARLELFRLPGAANRADVRLRFASTGSAAGAARRWFVDDVRFYDLGAPTDVQLPDSSVPEGLAIGAAVGRLVVTDPDAAETFQFTLVGGEGAEDNAWFTVTGDEVRTGAVFDFETRASYAIRVRATNGKGLWVERALVVTITFQPVVVARHVFYNQSAWDGRNGGANATDDAAVAPDKKPLFQGVKASLTNYTSYSLGLNGIMVDITGLPVGTPTASDFGFKVGRSGSPSTWAAGPAVESVSVRRGAGVGGSDRVTLIWNTNNAAKKTWLQVRVKATPATGLLMDDVFYFGNAVGEVGNSLTDAVVNSTDEVRIRPNLRNLLNPAPITNLYDINRDKQVNITDQILVRANITSPLSALVLITPGAPGSAAALALAGAGAGAGAGAEGGWVDSDLQGLTQDWRARAEDGASDNLPRMGEAEPDHGLKKPSGTLRLFVLSPGRIRLEAQGSEAGRMQLETCDRAPSGPWTVVSGAVREVAGTDRVSWTLSVDLSSGVRFYRWALRDGDTGSGPGSR
jgi:hypothetical protein